VTVSYYSLVSHGLRGEVNNLMREGRSDITEGGKGIWEKEKKEIKG
jgi:hypothetical protein